MKRMATIMALCIVLVTSQASAAGKQSTVNGGISVLLNGKPLSLDASPILRDGVTYVPMRSLLTALGAAVDWDGKTGTVTATHNNTTVKVKAKDRTGWKNGKSVVIDHPAENIDGTMYVSLRWINETFGAVVKWHGATRTVAVYYPEEGLPVVGSYEHLKALVSDAAHSSNVRFGRATLTMKESVAMNDAQTESKAAAESPASDQASASADYSATNTQVQGVDESDLVKTDGTYIYQVINDKVVIARVDPGDRMEIVSTLTYAGTQFLPSELYVDEDRLVVIGVNQPLIRYDTGVKPMVEEKKIMIYPNKPAVYTTKAIILDISDITNPRQIREAEIEGNYLSSRKIGSSLYLISNKYIDYYYIMNEKEESSAPLYRDSAAGDQLMPIGYDRIHYFPDSIEPNYMLVGGLNLDDADQPMDVKAYLGSGHNIYASTEHLYVAVTQYEQPAVEPMMERALPIDDSNSLIIRPVPPQSNKTVVYKFALNQGSVNYMAQGEAPGTILNQFSMDEYNGYFRIATTTGDMWRNDEFTSRNNLYVLDDSLTVKGMIEDIAPGERIYSVRFMGDRAYMVTFKSVDPLFVIDIANPQKPTILGALKIPGYSDYLHPYDENHLIGFGKDTMEVSNKNADGTAADTTAFYLGMKVAMLDVTDVTNPKELHKIIIGDRGTHSELLYNHKALLFSKAKNLLAFPVDLYEIKESNSRKHNSDMPEYGQFTYQGAYVYHIDSTSGFTLKGRISHLTQDQLDKAGQHGYNGDQNVRRILYINDTLYTLSNGMIKSNALSDLKEIGSLNIPK